MYKNIARILLAVSLRRTAPGVTEAVARRLGPGPAEAFGLSWLCHQRAGPSGLGSGPGGSQGKCSRMPPACPHCLAPARSEVGCFVLAGDKRQDLTYNGNLASGTSPCRRVNHSCLLPVQVPGRQARGDTAGGLGGGAPGACEAGRSTLRLPGWTPRRLVAAVAGGPRWQGAAGGAAASLCPRASHRPARLSPQVLLSGLIGVVSWKRPLSLVVSGARTRGGRGAGPRPRRCERPRGHSKSRGLLGGRGADLSGRAGARG